MTNGENSGRYADYGMPDFICDPFFQDWILHPDGESAAFWEEWVRQHPEKTNAIEEATLLLRSIQFRVEYPAEDRIQQSLLAAREKIKGMDGASPVVRIRRIGWAAAAAAVIGIAGYFLIGGHSDQRSYATPYAETHTIYLPDSSTLVLNAHSSVRYNQDWRRGQAREVWLDGEAYFDVRAMAASTFLVHVKELTVEVLGTAFDIRSRRGKTAIVLQSGKIRVRFPAGAHDDIIMAPGDKIVYDPAKAALAHMETVPENYTSWKDGKLTGATAGEIIEYLEDNYHKTIILDNQTLAQRKIGGVILLDNLDDALFALSTVLNVNIIQQQDTLILKPR